MYDTNKQLKAKNCKISGVHLVHRPRFKHFKMNFIGNLHDKLCSSSSLHIDANISY